MRIDASLGPESHKIVTFDSAPEMHAIGVGFLILEHITDEEILEVGAYRASAERRNGGRLNRHRETFTLSTERISEGILLGGLIWVAQERDKHSSDIFTQLAEAKGVEEAFEYFEITTLGERLESLHEIADQLIVVGDIYQFFVEHFQKGLG